MPKCAVAVANIQKRLHSSSQTHSRNWAHFPIEGGATIADPEDF